MLETLVAGAFLIGILGMFKSRRHCGGGAWHGAHHGTWGGPRGETDGPRGWGGGGRWARGGRFDARFARAAGEMWKRRLRIDEDQEGIVDHAIADLAASLKELGSVWNDSRTELASAFRGEKVDDGAIAAVFARHDEALARTRREVISALKQAHSVLDAEQRAKAADWLGERAEWV